MLAARRLRVSCALIALAALAPAALAGAPTRPKDPRSGERVLRWMYGTGDLRALRRRGFEIGTKEGVKERALRSARPARALAGSTWTLVGPVSRTSRDVTADNGRADAGMVANLAVHPTDARTIYLAAAGGGVWKTTDGGASWAALLDSQFLLPIGAVAVARSNPSRVYAGSGCGDASSYFQDFPGIGLLISNDAGATWRTSSTSPGSKFFELSVDPGNPDVVLAATDRGVMRSTDGGDTWAASVPVAAQSLSRAASNPLVVFAGTWLEGGAGSVWRSTDGGVTFAERTLPDIGARTRAEVAVAPSDPARVYALFADGKGGTLDMVRSTDGGDTWAPLGLLSKSPAVSVLGTQGKQFAAMAVDPSNPNVVYAGGLDLWKTTDAGSTWARISNWQGPTPDVAYEHADQHSINFASDGSALFTSDGGVWRSTDGGRTFQTLNRGLTLLQVYDQCATPLDPGSAMAGAQDNGTSLRISGGDFVEVLEGDGFGCYMSSLDPKVMVASAQNESLGRSTDGGQTFQSADDNFGLSDGRPDGEETPGSRFPTTLRRHPAHGDWVLAASKNRLWVSKDSGASFAATSGAVPGIGGEIRDFAVYADGSRIALAGEVTQDSGTAVALIESTDGGVSWTTKGTIPEPVVSSVRYDRTNPLKIWATTANPQPGRPHVCVSTDGGATWAARGSGLPDVPVHVFLQDATNAAQLWIGTYVGVYGSANGGLTWSRYGTGLPNVMVFDLIQLADGRVRAGTFGRGLWEIATAAGGGALQAAFAFAPESPAPGQAISFTDASSGSPTSWAWTFGDGAASSDRNPTHAFASAGAYTVALTVSDGSASSTSSRVVAVAASAGGESATLFVPIVLSAPGKNGSYFTSEMTVTNTGATEASVTYQYTAAFGGGDGAAVDTVPPGRQLVVTDAISYLKSKGVPIPSSGSRGGTLRVTFRGLASSRDVALTVRTTTPVPPQAPTGAAGLAYSGVPASRLLSGPAWLCGLRQNDTDRSNVAVQNAGAAGDGDVTIRATFFPGDGSGPAGSVDATLPPGGFKQVALTDIAASASNGTVKLERVSGSAAWYGYGVINDNANSDGSFVVPVNDGAIGADSGVTLPVVVEASVFTTEVVLANLSTSPKTVTAFYVADAIAGGQTTTSYTLAPGQQLLVPSFVQALRDAGAAGVGPAGPTFVGALFVSVPGGSASGVFVGGRTGNPGGGGRYGLFYAGVPNGAGASSTAYLYALQQNADNRSNLALANTGESDGGGTDGFRLEVFDGDTGAKAGETTLSLDAFRFTQINTVLGQVAPGVKNGYVKVTRTNGSNPFLSYGVVNDGGAPGQRSGDGAFVPADIRE